MSTPDRIDLPGAWAQCALTIEELWLAFVALGGTGTCRHVRALVQGLVPASPSEHLVLAHAFNEHFAERQEPVRVASPWSTG